MILSIFSQIPLASKHVRIFRIPQLLLVGALKPYPGVRYRAQISDYIAWRRTAKEMFTPVFLRDFSTPTLTNQRAQRHAKTGEQQRPDRSHCHTANGMLRLVDCACSRTFFLWSYFGTFSFNPTKAQSGTPDFSFPSIPRTS